MKKFLIAALSVIPQLALAQVPSNGPIIGVPDNTQCLSTGNNGFCNQYRPGGPAAVTGLETIPAYTNTGSPPTAVLAPVDALATYNRKNLSAYNPIAFDTIGDSRDARMFVLATNSIALSSAHWFNQANGLANRRYQLGINAGASGCRTDQYLAQSNLAPLLASNSQWVIFDFPAFNDMNPQTGNAGITAATSTTLQTCTNASGSFPYTNNNGTNVTSTNVGQVVADNIIAAVKQFLAAGKKVIITQEVGSTGFGVSQITQMYDLRARMAAFALATPGVYVWDAGPALWNPTSASNAIAFKTNVSLDGTHFKTLGGYYAGVAFNSFISGLIPVADTTISNINNVNSSNPRQLINNPLFTTVTGGTNTTCNTTGTVPSGWTLVCGQASTAVTITNGAEANGLGNTISLAITSAGADVIRFQSNAPSNTLWNLTDTFQSGMIASVANGSSNFSLFMSSQVASNLGTNFGWDMYSGQGTPLGDGPTTAYSYTLAAYPIGVISGSTSKSFNTPQLYMNFSAAGSATVTVSRAYNNRLYTYSSSAGFTGQ